MSTNNNNMWIGLQPVPECAGFWMGNFLPRFGSRLYFGLLWGWCWESLCTFSYPRGWDLVQFGSGLFWTPCFWLVDLPLYCNYQLFDFSCLTGFELLEVFRLYGLLVWLRRLQYGGTYLEILLWRDLPRYSEWRDLPRDPVVVVSVW